MDENKYLKSEIERLKRLLQERDAEILQQEAELDILRGIYKQENQHEDIIKWNA